MHLSTMCQRYIYVSKYCRIEILKSVSTNLWLILIWSFVSIKFNHNDICSNPSIYTTMARIQTLFNMTMNYSVLISEIMQLIWLQVTLNWIIIRLDLILTVIISRVIDNVFQVRTFHSWLSQQWSYLNFLFRKNMFQRYGMVTQLLSIV